MHIVYNMMYIFFIFIYFVFCFFRSFYFCLCFRIKRVAAVTVDGVNELNEISYQFIFMSWSYFKWNETKKKRIGRRLRSFINWFEWLNMWYVISFSFDIFPLLFSSLRSSIVFIFPFSISFHMIRYGVIRHLRHND